MRDFARSESAAVQAQLDRLGELSVPDGRLGLETIRALLARLGDPHKRLPPVFHVAGTNGKGSTCAFLRAMLEAQGYKVHATTSPHLVRYNERIRIAGKLIADERLAELLAEVLDAGEDLNPSFFEVTIAAAFTEFVRVPADACVVEVGLGGRFDATNVLEPAVLAACGIAALGIDHERFLLAPEDGVPTEPITRIAFEKAGIAKRDVPLATYNYLLQTESEIRRVAELAGARYLRFGDDWYAEGTECGHYEDRRGRLCLPPPNLAGQHQYDNAGLAIAMLRHQSKLPVDDQAILEGMRTANWPARMQQLSRGPLTVLANDVPVTVDGGHNASAGEAIAKAFSDEPSSLHLILGMLENKNPRSLIEPLGNRIRSLTVVPVPGHDSHRPEAFGPEAQSARTIEEALLGIPNDNCPILIAGSLYLAGEVLRLNDEIPD